jgi:NADH dehydrogenase
VSSSNPPRHVVVIGGGFGGVAAARALSAAPVRVTLVDRRNHHLFQPLLYQVATAGLSAPDIATPIRQMFRGRDNVEVLLAEVTRVDVERRRVELDDGMLEYDGLIVAAGATNHWFGHDGWGPHAPGLKSLEDALDIRNRVLTAYELAERSHDEAVRAACLTFVVIGAGPTGVEMAGALSEIARTTLTRNFRRIDPALARVCLVEGGPRVLAGFPEPLSASAQQQLAEIGVEVLTGEKVTAIDATGVTTSSRRIDARTVVWAAGVRAESVVATLGAPLDRMGRAMVEADLSIPGHGEVFVVGDAAHLERDGVTMPGVAPVAMQQGRAAAENLLARLRGAPTRPFCYFDKGSMATVGRRRAVAMSGTGSRWPQPTPTLQFSGFVAWLAWLFVHLMVLVDFRNRVAVFLEWAWAWMTFERSARVILGPTRQPRARE